MAVLLVGLLVCISTGANLMGTYLLKPVINRFIMPGDMSGLVRAVVRMGGMYLCGALATLGSVSYTHLTLPTILRV